MYKVIRKHSSDNNSSDVAYVHTKKEAREFIKQEIKKLNSIWLPQQIKSLGDVKRVEFSHGQWSISFWFEEMTAEQVQFIKDNYFPIQKLYPWGFQLENLR